MARIVIIDDTVLMRKLLGDILVAQGHDIVGEGATAQEAVDQFQAFEPDLMTLDITMPLVGGVDTPEAIRRIKKGHPGAKILMVSSLGQPGVVAAMLEAGACDFIVKPFDEDVIIKTVSRILGF